MLQCQDYEENPRFNAVVGHGSHRCTRIKQEKIICGYLRSICQGNNMEEDQVVEIIQTKIYSIRNQKVMLDSDIAELYGVETKRVNEAVRNNPDKFPEDFYLELNVNEQDFLRSKFSTLKKR